MKLPAALFVLLSLAACARAPEVVRPEAARSDIGRFQIVNGQYLSSDTHLILKIDTQTGQTWALSARDRVGTVWIPVTTQEK